MLVKEIYERYGQTKKFKKLFFVPENYYNVYYHGNKQGSKCFFTPYQLTFWQIQRMVLNIDIFLECEVVAFDPCNNHLKYEITKKLQGYILRFMFKDVFKNIHIDPLSKVETCTLTPILKESLEDFFNSEYEVIHSNHHFEVVVNTKRQASYKVFYLENGEILLKPFSEGQ